MLQTLAFGERCDKIPDQININIRQKNGLNLQILQTCSKHPDLIKIAALDTFINNRDRSAPNLFYDQITDHYCGIDHLAAFSDYEGPQLLSSLTSEFVERYLGVFTKEQQKALILYKDILKNLYDNFSPEVIIKEIYSALKYFSNQYQLCHSDYKITVEQKINNTCNRITKNHDETRNLLKVLDESIYKFEQPTMTTCIPRPF